MILKTIVKMNTPQIRLTLIYLSIILSLRTRIIHVALMMSVKTLLLAFYLHRANDLVRLAQTKWT